jgi:hypothetical protein
MRIRSRWTPDDSLRPMTLRVLLLAMVLLASGQDCHPVCQFVCNVPNGTASCSPVCLPPVCSAVSCGTTAPMRCHFPQCHSSCPPDQCQVSCPACEVLCSPLPTVCQEAGCLIQCQEIECSWDCSVPAYTPTNLLCEWQCDAPPCGTQPSSSSRLEPGLAHVIALLLAAVGLFGLTE